jgi:hypothetical protein
MTSCNEARRGSLSFQKWKGHVKINVDQLTDVALALPSGLGLPNRSSIRRFARVRKISDPPSGKTKVREYQARQVRHEASIIHPQTDNDPLAVRVKPGALDAGACQTGALDRLGNYAECDGFKRFALFCSQDLDEQLIGYLTASLWARKIEILQRTSVESI